MSDDRAMNGEWGREENKGDGWEMNEEHPPPPCFLAQSLEEYESKRVGFWCGPKSAHEYQKKGF
jgi:hypothetical protein